MFSPYNAKAAALILTGAKSQGVLASTREYREEYFYVQRRCHCGRSELSSL